jgi:hypothetical protein
MSPSSSSPRNSELQQASPKSVRSVTTTLTSGQMPSRKRDHNDEVEFVSSNPVKKMRVNRQSIQSHCLIAPASAPTTNHFSTLEHNSKLFQAYDISTCLDSSVTAEVPPYSPLSSADTDYGGGVSLPTMERFRFPSSLNARPRTAPRSSPALSPRQDPDSASHPPEPVLEARASFGAVADSFLSSNIFPESSVPMALETERNSTPLRSTTVTQQIASCLTTPASNSLTVPSSVAKLPNSCTMISPQRESATQFAQFASGRNFQAQVSLPVSTPLENSAYLPEMHTMSTQASTASSARTAPLSKATTSFQSLPLSDSPPDSSRESSGTKRLSPAMRALGRQLRTTFDGNLITAINRPCQACEKMRQQASARQKCGAAIGTYRWAPPQTTRLPGHSGIDQSSPTPYVGPQNSSQLAAYGHSEVHLNLGHDVNHVQSLPGYSSQPTMSRNVATRSEVSWLCPSPQDSIQPRIRSSSTATLRAIPMFMTEAVQNNDQHQAIRDKHIIADIADTCAASFPFDEVAKRHHQSAQKVRDLFSILLFKFRPCYV